MTAALTTRGPATCPPGARVAAALQQLERTPAPAPTPQPADRAAAMEAHLMESRLAFGRLLVAWQRRNGWSQDAPARIAIAAGFDGFDVHNSQWSQVSSGKLAPKPKFFAALALLNELVADTTWAAKPGTNPRARQYLDGATALLRDDGTPWGPADFFAAFVGA